MTAQSWSFKRKLSLLQLADGLNNVSRACKVMGYYRDTFYETRRTFQTGGVGTLFEQRRCTPGPHRNRVSPEIEARVLRYCLARPPTARSGSPTNCAWPASRSRPRGYAAPSCVPTWRPATSTSCAWSATAART